MNLRSFARAAALIFAAASTFPAAAAEQELALLNVSYDPTRELWRDINEHFIADYKAKTGVALTINQSHGGSSTQARAVIDGLEADVVTLAVSCDIDAIAARARLLEPGWQARLPHHSAPYTSTIVFVVRRGNPKRVLGDARRAQDPAAAGVLKAAEPRARDFVAELYRHVPVLDQGARGATLTFAQKGIGDVLLAWENEASQLLRERGTEGFEIVVPSLSILAEPPVAVVDTLAQKHGTLEVAQAYLEFLYAPAAQALAARHFLRPVSTEGVAAADLSRFPKLELFAVDEVFGDWAAAQKKHFEDDGVFDRIWARTRRGTLAPSDLPSR